MHTGQEEEEEQCWESSALTTGQLETLVGACRNPHLNRRRVVVHLAFEVPPVPKPTASRRPRVAHDVLNTFPRIDASCHGNVDTSNTV